MRLWDSSAVVPLLVDEERSDVARAAYGDGDLTVWWATPVECASALARREREGTHAADEIERARTRLAALGDAWREVEPTSAIRIAAMRALRVHDLREADALQLAAALALSSPTEPAELLTFDDRLARAAAREGLVVIGP